MNLNQVTFPVNNMPEATEFYRQMGFIQIVDTPHYARFECPDGDSTFSLSLDDTPAESLSAKNRSSQNNSSSPTKTVIYFEHEKLDEWVEDLVARGFHFDQMPKDQTYLWREAILHDPSGNKIKLFWAGENRRNPPWRVEKMS